jgi:hypothetical protein
MRNSTSLRALLPAAIAFGCLASAQVLRVYSPFTRVDPFGNVVSADRGGNEPREILSPALPRNATTGFHLTVSGDPGAEFTLYIGENPEDAAGVTLYRESYTKAGAEWFPDAIEPVTLPYHGRILTEGIPGQTVQSFWMDLHVARGAQVQRVKIEPQASFKDRWVHYPMEARIVITAAPSLDFRPNAAAAPLASPSDFSARRVVKQKLCGIAEKNPPRTAVTIRDLIVRDALQDLAMASVVPADELWKITGSGDRPGWCRGEQAHTDGPEWYLKIRDRIVGAKR